MSASETIGLFEIEPDLGRYMNAADREAVGGLHVPVTTLPAGGLVGARRSTVTLALSQLAEDGSIVREEGGWMLRKLPPVFAEPHVARVPELLVPLETVPE